MLPEHDRTANDGTMPADQARPRVLIVEDNATSRLVVARQLQRLGVAVTAVDDGTQAVEAVRQGRFDAVLMDRHLPGVDGLEATRLIRRLPGGHDLPVIALTADTAAEPRRECLDAGMDDCVTKPVDMAGLGETLWRWLPSPANPGPRLDREALARVREELDDEALFAELVTTFLAELPRRWAALAGAAALAEADRLSGVAHQLGGAAAQVGASRLAALCRSVEAGPADEPAATLAAIETECLGLPFALRRACPGLV